MLRDQQDNDYGFEGGNNIPRLGYSRVALNATYPTTSVFASNFDCKSLTMEAAAMNIGMDTLTLNGGSNLSLQCSTESATRELSTVNNNNSGDDNMSPPFPFMDLPLEIRLEVYQWIHLMTPVGPTQSKPWYRNPANRAYQVKTITATPAANTEQSSETDNNKPENTQHHQTPLLMPCRPNNYMPTSILRASKQIYHETRHLPFIENEFAFINWFTSGPWAARSFVRGLAPWQRDAMRYARLELLSRDLSERYAGEWAELCEAWAPGLRGLRLKILNGGNGVGEGSAEGGVFGIGTTVSGGLSWAVVGLPQKDAPMVRVRDGEGLVERWVMGLRGMRQLRCLEVELAIAEWDDGVKVAWCGDLEDAVNEGRGEGVPYVRVCCVEREEE